MNKHTAEPISQGEERMVTEAADWSSVKSVKSVVLFDSAVLRTKSCQTTLTSGIALRSKELPNGVGIPAPAASLRIGRVGAGSIPIFFALYIEHFPRNADLSTRFSNLRDATGAEMRTRS